ncbi:MAG TPA: PIN domain-containing protein, partial [Gammaproteobacteria bacterium]|nr:PIN domain-containing protein [Gammaproteobacteria bacterium]
FFHAQDPVQTYREAAMMYFKCRKKGIKIRSTNDCLIARIAIEYDLSLLHSDQDFTRLAEVVPELKLI